MFKRSLMLLVLCCWQSLPVQAALEDEIFTIMQSVHQGEPVQFMAEPVRAGDILDVFYAGREYAPAWEGYDYIKQVLAEVAGSEQEGLNPEDYHYSALLQLVEDYRASGERNQRVRAQFDVLLSDGILLYARHLQEGKVDPGAVEESWNFSRREFDPQTVASRLSEAIKTRKVVEILEDMKPDVEFYGLMKNELQRFKGLEKQYVFQPVPDDTVLKPGMQHPNVAALREQLARLGLASRTTATPDVFDDALRDSVEQFQRLHAVDVDGVVGGQSFRALNVSYADRADQIRLNLDRVRWVQDDRTEEMVLVNIAGYEMYYFRDDEVAWRTDVMVGTIRNETPIFHASMSYLVLNPTWTVPRSIIRKSLFAKFAADPGYVKAHNYKLYDSEGVEADPASMDWASYSRNRFPYRVVQQPGPGNALGRVKFMFPNKHAVYLHDTPSRALFSRTDRAFSHGCVRVKDPLNFADLLLEDNTDWNRQRIDETVSVTEQHSPEQTVLRLKKPVDVMLMYWTVSPTIDGDLQFHPDVYQRDPKSLASLKETPHWARL
ncbi:MAG: L,D-transpeptidase family protein [Halieaceae bacterium]